MTLLATLHCTKMITWALSTESQQLPRKEGMPRSPSHSQMMKTPVCITSPFRLDWWVQPFLSSPSPVSSGLPS